MLSQVLKFDINSLNFPLYQLNSTQLNSTNQLNVPYKIQNLSYFRDMKINCFYKCAYHNYAVCTEMGFHQKR